MKYELTIYELGKIIKTLEEKYSLEVLIKKTLSGGWLTISGKAKVVNIPTIKGSCGGKGSNILEIKVLNNTEEGSSFKITGGKDKKFNIDVAATRYKEINFNSISLNQIKTNDKECKLRIDEDVIFTIKGALKEVEEILNHIQSEE